MTFYTARQLDDLHRLNGANGHLVLPYRARLTPAAQDWVKSKRVQLVYTDDQAQPDLAVARNTTGSTLPESPSASPPPAGAFVWWCDGPCGPAKAALVAQEKESNFRPLEAMYDPRHVVGVVRRLAADVKSGQIAGGVLLVQSGAAAVVYANRCPSLRAVMGTSIEAVDQGVQQVAANVLVIEHPHKTLQQVKNLLGRFVRAKRELSEDVRRQIQELASCG